MVEEMRNGGYNVGGEQSATSCSPTIRTTGDGLIAALYPRRAVQRQDRPVWRSAIGLSRCCRCSNVCFQADARLTMPMCRRGDPRGR